MYSCTNSEIARDSKILRARYYLEIVTRTFTKEAKENHFHELAETYEECRKGNVTINMGDMDVRLQARAEGE